MLLRSVRGTQRAAEPGWGGSVLTLFPVQIPSLHSTGWNVCSNINKFLGVWFQHSMAVVIHLQVVPIAVGTMDFSGLTIPDGGVHIVGGELGE